MLRTFAAGLLALATALHAQAAPDTVLGFAIMPGVSDMPAGAKLVRQSQHGGQRFNRQLQSGDLEVATLLMVLAPAESGVEQLRGGMQSLDQYSAAVKVTHQLEKKVVPDSVRAGLVMLPTGPGREAIRRAMVARVHAAKSLRYYAQVELGTKHYVAIVSLNGNGPEAAITAQLHRLITLVESRIETASPTPPPPPPPTMTVSAGPPVNVVDFYALALRNDELAGDWVFVRGAQGWKCLSRNEPYEAVPQCVVDIANGYIELKRVGERGEITIEQLALFKKTDGGVILAYNEIPSESDAKRLGRRRGLPAFLLYSDRRFIRVAQSVMPDPVTPEHFGAPDGTVAYVYYSLPRIGTSIKARYHEFQCMACKKKEVTLTFDKVAGRFRIQP